MNIKSGDDCQVLCMTLSLLRSWQCQ